MTFVRALVRHSFLVFLVALFSFSFLAPGPARSLEFGTGDTRFDLSGFLGVGNAVRLSDVGDLQIGYETLERRALVAQLNKARLSLFGTYPRNVSSQLTLDLLYTSEPLRPFDKRGEVLLDEAYADFYYKDFDIRLGLQKVIWGKADLISPFDVLTARDFKDPFVWPTLEDRIAQAGFRVNYNWGEYAIEGVFFPVWIRSKAPLAETRDPESEHATTADQWFPPMAVYPAVGVLIDDPTVDLSWFIFLPTYDPLKKPKTNLSTATVGLKVNRLVGDYDIDFYLLTTMDPTPTAEVVTQFETGTLPGIEGRGLFIQIRGHMEYKRVTTIGAAGARTLGPFALRSEMALLMGKQYFRLFDPEDAATALEEALLNDYSGEARGEPKSHSEYVWITGLDYEIPRYYVLTSSQLAITKRFQHEDFYTQAATDVDWTFLLRRNFLADYLALSLTGMVSLRTGALWISPAVNYTLPMYEDLQLGARFSIFGGDDFSRLGMYGDQSSFIMSARWLF